MFTFFRKIVEKISTLSTNPVVQRTGRIGSNTAITGISANEIRVAFLTAANSSVPITHRSIAAFKGSCCTGALVTSYLAAATPSPGLSAAFEVCCATFSAGYVFSGGKATLALNYLFNCTIGNKK